MSQLFCGCSFKDLSGLSRGASGGALGGFGGLADAGGGAGESSGGSVVRAGGGGSSGEGDTAGMASGGHTELGGSAGAPPEGGGDAGPAPITVAPVHRYEFNGKDLLAKDSIGSADGALSGGAKLDGKGQLLLDGLTGVVEFPAHLLSQLPEATLMLWVNWSSQVDGQAVTLLSFGSSDVSQVSLLARDSPEGGANLSFGGQTLQLLAGSDLPHDKWVQVALTIPPAGQAAKLFRDGIKLGEFPSTAPLSSLEDTNPWLGRHQLLMGHAKFCGRINELRIYDRALEECEVAAAFSAAPENLAFACPK